MKRTTADIERLKAELLTDREDVDAVLISNGRAVERINAGADDELDFGALGYTIHNIYGLMENTCLRISRFFENNLSRDSGHKDLLDRMRLDIEGVRPAFLDRESFLLLDDLIQSGLE